MRQFIINKAATLGLCSAAVLLPALALANTTSPVPVFKPVPFPATDEQKRQILASPEITVDGKSTPISFNTILRSGHFVNAEPSVSRVSGAADAHGAAGLATGGRTGGGMG